MLTNKFINKSKLCWGFSLICMITIINSGQDKHYELLQIPFTSDKVPGYPDLPDNTRIVYVITPADYDDPTNIDIIIL